MVYVYLYLPPLIYMQCVAIETGMVHIPKELQCPQTLS